MSKQITQGLFQTMKIGIYMMVIFSMTMTYTFIDVPQSSAGAPTIVTGRIVAGGIPVGIGDVGLELANSGLSPIGTDPDGTFTFTNVPPGNYTLNTFINDKVALAGYISVTYNNIEVSSGLTTNIGDVALTQTTKTIKATVYYKDTTTPVVGAEVGAFSMEGNGAYQSCNTGSNGKCNVGVIGGKWGISVSGGYDEYGQPKQVEWIYSGMFQDISFVNDNSVESRNVNYGVVETDSVLKLTVKMPNGSPAQQININLFNTSGANISGQTGADGKLIMNAPAGNYELSAWLPPELSRYNLPRQKVSLITNQTLNLGIVTMSEKTSKFQGRVLTDTGTPLANVRINAFEMGQGNGDFSETQTGADGKFNLWVNSGYYGVEPQSNPESDYVYDGSSSSDYTIGENQVLNIGNIVMVKADVSINGVVKVNGVKLDNFYGYANVTDANNMNKMGKGKYYGAPIQGGEFIVKVPSNSLSKVLVETWIDPQLQYSLEAPVEVSIQPNGVYKVTLNLLPNNAVLRGFVVDQDGVRVRAEDYEFGDVFLMGGNMGKNAFVEDGAYSMSLRSGTYDGIGVFLQGGGFLDTPPKFEKGGVVIPTGITERNLEVKRANASINITLKDPNGNLLEGFGFAFAHQHFTNNPIENPKDIIETGGEIKNGRGTIPIVAGRYMVGAPTPKEFGGANWMPPEEVEVNVGISGSVDVVLQYTEADGTVRARVVDESGEPVPFGFIGGWTENGQNTGSPIFGSGIAEIPVNKGATWIMFADTFNGADYYTSGEVVITTPNTKDFVIEKTFVVKKSEFMFPQAKCETWDSTEVKVIGLSDGATFTFPATSLAQSGNVTACFKPEVNLYPEKTKKPAKGFGYDITATDSNNQAIINFNSAITAEFPVELDKMLGNGVTNAEQISLAYYDDNSSKWQDENTCVYKESTGMMTCQLTHFTDYALVTGAASLATPVASDVIVTPASAGGPQVTIWDYEGNMKANFMAYASNIRSGIQARVGDFNGDDVNEIVTVPGAGVGPQVRIFDTTGQPIDQFNAYQGHLRMGVNMEVADMDGDGNDEIITAPMTGEPPHIRIMDGKGVVEVEFFAYDEMFKGGVNIATGDVDGDGAIEIITSPASGGAPDIRIFNGDGPQVTGFYAYAMDLRGGFKVKTAELNADAVVDIMVTPGKGFGPQVAMFTGTGELIGRFWAYAPTFNGGINAVAGDVTGDSNNEIIITPMTQGGPHVRVFDYQGQLITDFWAYAQNLRGGYTPTLMDIDQDGGNEIVTTPGSGFGPHLRAFEYDGTLVSSFFTHYIYFRGGITASSIPTL